jgi:thiamine kinase-like enzyme
VASFEKIESNHLIKQRVTHHDTKISNVLFNEREKGICIIDLDTLMPGYFISDLGDMMRTYLSPASEEEKNFDKIEIRDDFFKAIIAGYVGTMGDELTSEEQELIFFSGQFLTYMQAMRFLTDHLNNDIYYGAAYDDHNFIRAGNQIQLLKKLEEKREMFEEIIRTEIKK